MADGLATQSLDVLTTRCIWGATGPRYASPRRGGAPGTHCASVAMGATRRDCRVPLALRECKGWTRRTVMN